MRKTILLLVALSFYLINYGQIPKASGFGGKLKTNKIGKSAKIPQKYFWIQSAMSIGTPGGCWDVPGGPKAGKNGQNIICWNIDNGKDRLFKFVPSLKFKGYYEIHSALGVALDNQGGKNNLRKNGNNIHLWTRHGGASQVFRVKHLGKGKIKIYNYGGYVVHLEGRKNANGTNIKIWKDHNGKWMEWYLINPKTRKIFVPKKPVAANETFFKNNRAKTFKYSNGGMAFNWNGTAKVLSIANNIITFSVTVSGINPMNGKQQTKTYKEKVEYFKGQYYIGRNSDYPMNGKLNPNGKILNLGGEQSSKTIRLP